MSTTNPAERLLGHLTKIRDLARGNQSIPMRQVWGSLFDVAPNDSYELYRIVFSLIAQIKQAKEDVIRVESANHDLYIEPLTMLDQLFRTISLDETSGQFMSRLNDTTLSALRYPADLLRQHLSRPDLSDEILSELLDDSSTILNSVLEAHIHPTLKMSLIEHIERFRRSILEYELRGPEGVRETIDLNLGFIIRNFPSAPDSNARSTIREAMTWIVGVSKIVYTASTMAKLGESLGDIFGLLQSGVPASGMTDTV